MMRALLALLLIPSLAWADLVTLEWDAVQDARVGLYEVHWGQASGAYTETQTVAVPDTTAEISAGVGEWFVAVRACTDGMSICSGWSNEVSFIVADSIDPPERVRTVIQITITQ